MKKLFVIRVNVETRPADESREFRRDALVIHVHADNESEAVQYLTYAIEELAFNAVCTT